MVHAARFLHAPAEALRRFRLARTARFWGRFAARHHLITWLAEPVVRRYVNACVTGDPNVWPIDGLAPRFGRVERAVSLGCGDGTLDRQLRQREICASLTGVDVSEEALEVAREKAREENVSGLDYVRGDLDRLELASGSCELAVFHQSLHHVRELEACLDTVHEALAPGGLVFLDEYVGPSQTEWNRDLLAGADAVYRSLPSRVRRRSRLQIPVDGRDPSEAVRASEIVTELSKRFAVELRRDYGGTLLAVIYPHLDFSRVAQAERDAILEELVAAERSALASGAGSFYTVIFARKAAA